MDPRVKTPQADLLKQFEMAQQISAAQTQVGAVLRSVNRLHEQLQRLASDVRDRKSLGDQLAVLDRKATALAGGAPVSGPSGGMGSPASDAGNLRALSAALGAVARAVESADVAPTADAVTAFQRDRQAMQKVLAQWNEIKMLDVPKLNASLKAASLPPVSLEERNRQER
jgi:hypothetical protein